MSWAVDRQTTREEDIAYSLMGLFDINMPLIYGEGPKAFIRLQEEILRQSDDHTLFAWRSAPESTIHGTASGLLADHPRNFRSFRSWTSGNPAGVHDVHTDHLVRVWDDKAPQNPITITNKGIRITSRVLDLQAAWNPEQSMVLVLNCSPGGDLERATGIYIQRQYEDRYARVRTDELADVRLNHAIVRTSHTLHCLKAGGADILGHQFDQPWTTSFDIQPEYHIQPQYSPLQRLEGQHSDDGTAFPQRYQSAFQLRRNSFKTITAFGAYILYSMGISQAHGAWRFLRFDSHSKGKDAIFDTSSGHEFALLYRTPTQLDLLVVILGVNSVTGKHWVNAVCVDDEELTREGSNMAKILKGIRELSQPHQGYSSQSLVLVAEKSLYILVRVQPRLVEGISMHDVHLSGPWPHSWFAFIKERLSVTIFLIVAVFWFMSPIILLLFAFLFWLDDLWL